MLRFAAIGLEMCSGVSEVKFDTKHATNALRMPAKSGEITQNPKPPIGEWKGWRWIEQLEKIVVQPRKGDGLGLNLTPS